MDHKLWLSVAILWLILVEEQKATCAKFEWYTIISDDRSFQIGYLDVDYFEMSLNQEGFKDESRAIA